MSKRPAEIIEDIITNLEQMQSDHSWHCQKVKECNDETSDILHSIELDGLLQAERNKLATRLAKVRKSRRQHKDIFEATQPIATFLETDEGKRLMKVLKQTLGETRKVQNYHDKRVYRRRIQNE